MIAQMERPQISAPARESLRVASRLNAATLEKSYGANKKLNMFFGFPGGGAAATASR